MIEGSNAVLELEEHLYRIVAELIGVELEIIRSGDLSIVVRLPDCYAIGLGFKSHC